RCRDHLLRLIAGPDWSHAMAASLLHALPGGWVPDRRLTALSTAYLAGAAWPGAALEKARLIRTDFTDADLSRANLSGAQARRALFRRANLCRAVLIDLNAPEVDFAGADLSLAFASN